MIEDAGGKALDELSTKIRPNKRYKTERKDLDDGSMQLLATKLNNILTDPKNINRIWPNMHGNKPKYLDMGEHWGNFHQHSVQEIFFNKDLAS